MDDEIDIEEHNLLEHPAIRTIFPDLSVLKDEIPGYCEDLKQESIVLEESGDLNTSSLVSQDNNEKININSENSDIEEDVIFVEKRQPPVFGNKIILGSKRALDYDIVIDSEEITEKIYSSYINLVDAGVYLEKCGKFCKICLILFQSIESLLTHNNKYHNNVFSEPSHLMDNCMRKAIYKCDKCPKKFTKHGCLIKHNRTVHDYNSKTESLVTGDSLNRKSLTKRNIVNSKYNRDNKCFHCKKIFKSNKLLIEHMYIILCSNKNINNTSSKTIARSIQNRRSNKIQNKHTNRSESLQNTKTKLLRFRESIKTHSRQVKAKSFFLTRCIYCSYYFRNSKMCLRHIQSKHKDQSAVKVKTVLFDGQCKYCSLTSQNWYSYNQHLRKSHMDKVYSTFKINLNIVLPRVEMGFVQRTKLRKIAPYERNEMDLSDSSQNMEDKNQGIVNNLNKTRKHLKIDTSESFKDTKDADLITQNSNKRSLVLKSVLFKCKKCDIHFLDAKSTTNHKEHMELLIHWKCYTCQNIFKKQDEFAHEEQHKVSNTFDVIELDTSAVAYEKLLFKCSKCAIHFKENNYHPHFYSCGLTITESVYCKLCDILIDKCIARYHVRDHRLGDSKPEDYTIISSDAIVVPIESKIGNYARIRTASVTDDDTNNKSAHCSDTKVTNGALTKPENGKQKFDADLYLKLIYCRTCETFLTELSIIKRSIHLSSRCSNLPKVFCKYCGLTFTKSSMRRHNALHKRRKNINLRDFTFYSLESGKQIMTPPMPQYPKCHKCDVHFLSKMAVISHACSDEFLTCHICSIKVSESLFKPHVAFHYYSNTLNSHFIDGEKVSTNDKPIKQKPNLKYNSTNGPALKSRNKPSRKINNELNQSLENLAMEYINESDVSKTNNDIESTSSKTKVKKIKETKHSILTLNDVDSIKKTDYELYNVLYCCFSCSSVIDLYDEVVEHCQNHLCGFQMETEICRICKMTVERKSSSDHCRLHKSNKNKKSFKLITFDMFYFTLGSDLWVNHVFESLSTEIKSKILERSIYGTCKIKMKVIQDGFPDLTFYKCSSCANIVSPDSLCKHAETSCFKTRKYPCTLCGLPFSSYLLRKDHEIIHSTKNVTQKSYRIVLFNQKNEKPIDKLLTKINLFFFLYQCRNCSAIVDKYQRSSHKCNLEALMKCNICDLLILGSDCKAHHVKHINVPNFVQRNMKVVLFGQKDTTGAVISKEREIPCFDGTFIDYTFYQCVECGVCFEKPLNHNTSCVKTSQWKCPKCKLFISKNRMAYHLKMHDRHDDFVRENMNIVPYSAGEMQVNFIPVGETDPNSLKNNKEIDSKESKYVPRNKTNVTPGGAEVEKTIERTVKLFECNCGLNFIDVSSIKAHFHRCNPRMAKERCSKCSYLFTPTILFDHMLLHHGDKKYNFKFNVVKMSKYKSDIVTTYKCGNCDTHFVEHFKANAHFEICTEVGIERTKCKVCNLFFDILSIEHHEKDHHKDSIADIDIVDINTCRRVSK